MKLEQGILARCRQLHHVRSKILLVAGVVRVSQYAVASNSPHLMQSAIHISKESVQAEI
jgi:hypothetical protein